MMNPFMNGLRLINIKCLRAVGKDERVGKEERVRLGSKVLRVGLVVMKPHQWDWYWEIGSNDSLTPSSVKNRLRANLAD